MHPNVLAWNSRTSVTTLSSSFHAYTQPDVIAGKNLIFTFSTVSVFLKDAYISHEATALNTLLAQCLTGEIFFTDASILATSYPGAEMIS